MRTLFLLSLTLFLHCFAFGQTIPLDSFYAPGASWTEVAQTEYWPCSTGPSEFTYGIVYKIERDSIISGKTYHLLSKCFKGNYGFITDCNSGSVSNYIGADTCPTHAPVFAMIRTDSNRVYFTLLKLQAWSDMHYYCDTPGTEYLMYDFNLSVDSVSPSSNLIDGFTVSNIDSVTVSNGAKVPRYRDSLGYYELIYGIGSQSGFINYWHLYVCGPGPSADQYLLCYNNPHFSYHFSYPPGTLPGRLQYDCFNMVSYMDSLTSVPKVTAKTITKLYPNPVTNLLTISAPQTIKTVIISNLLGQTIYNLKFNSDKVHIYVAKLLAGVYTVRINGTEVRKFVKE